jgi:very-short-patch-repair endonuclease
VTAPSLRILSPGEKPKRRAKAKVDRYTMVLPMLRALAADACAEHRFHARRGWLFDFAFPSSLVAIEIDGGTWTGGRHTRGAGFEEDCRKLNAAACQGWRVLRFLPADIQSGLLLTTVRNALSRTPMP